MFNLKAPKLLENYGEKAFIKVSVIPNRAKWGKISQIAFQFIAKLSFNFNYNLVESLDGYILNFPSHPATNPPWEVRNDLCFNC